MVELSDDESCFDMSSVSLTTNEQQEGSESQYKQKEGLTLSQMTSYVQKKGTTTTSQDAQSLLMSVDSHGAKKLNVM